MHCCCIHGPERLLPASVLCVCVRMRAEAEYNGVDSASGIVPQETGAFDVGMAFGDGFCSTDEVRSRSPASFEEPHDQEKRYIRDIKFVPTIFSRF